MKPIHNICFANMFMGGLKKKKKKPYSRIKNTTN